MDTITVCRDPRRVAVGAPSDTRAAQRQREGGSDAAHRRYERPRAAISVMRSRPPERFWEPKLEALATEVARGKRKRAKAERS